jgi:hypothetical protein
VAVVCDVADFYDLRLSDEQIGAQVLVLWSASGQPIRSVAFTGHRVKKVIKRVETQLGVRR